MRMMIPMSDDSNTFLETEIGITLLHLENGETKHYPKTGNVTIGMYGRQNPIHDGIVNYFEHLIKENYYYELGIEFSFYDCYAIVEKNPYCINGQKMTLKNLCHILARMTYTSINDKDRLSLGAKLRNWMTMPNDVAYVLENRVPFHWYEAGRKIDVRLNIKEIGQQTAALEIGDGTWASISFKDLNVFLGFYLHNNKKGSWKHMSPAKLYERLLGEEPSESELEVMVAFLSQNRTSIIVEERAKELLKSMAKQYSDRIYMDKINDLIHIRVKGKKYEWLLIERQGFSESSTQKVSVFVLGADFITSHTNQTQEDLDLNGGTVTNYVESTWRGPICIDNMALGSSLGDQFASRIFAVMNDTMTVARVSTLSHYLENTYSPAEIELDEGLYDINDLENSYQEFRFEHRRLHSTITTIITTTTKIEEEFR